MYNVEVTFFKTGKPINSTLQPTFDSAHDTKLYCELFEPFNLQSPTIIVDNEHRDKSVESEICRYNHCYVGTPLNRYYWISNWERRDGLWNAYCTEDYLASFRDDILNTKQYVLRTSNSSLWDDRIPDNMYGYQCTPYSSSSAAFKMVTSGYTYKTPEGGNGFGNHRLYAWINSCFLSYNTAAGGNLYTSTDSYLVYNFDTMYYAKILGKLKNNVDSQKVNLSNFISRLYYLPIEPLRNNDVYDDVFGAGPEVKGKYPNLLYYGYQKDAAKPGAIDLPSDQSKVGITFDYIGTPKATTKEYEIRAVKENKYVDLIWTATIPDKSNIEWQNGSERTVIYINFQPFGNIQVNANLLAGRTDCQLTQRIYLATGDSILYLDTGLGPGMQLAAANVAQEIPISTIVNNGEAYRRQEIQNAYDVGSAVMSTAAATVTGAVSGGLMGGLPGAVLGAVTSLGTGLINTANMAWKAADRPPIQTNGSISGISSSILTQVPTISVLRYNTNDRYDYRFGRPICKPKKLSEMGQGSFCLCQNAIFGGSGIGWNVTSTERQAIEQALNGGVYLE